MILTPAKRSKAPASDNKSHAFKALVLDSNLQKCIIIRHDQD